MAGNSKPAKRQDLSVQQNPCYRKIGKESNSVRSCKGVWNFTVPSVAHVEDEAKAFIRTSRQHKPIAEKR